LKTRRGAVSSQKDLWGGGKIGTIWRPEEPLRGDCDATLKTVKKGPRVQLTQGAHVVKEKRV